MTPCPGCGGWTVLPHCTRPGCDSSWCERAQCGWESVAGCELNAAPPKRLRPYPETVMDRRHFLPVLSLGAFRKSFMSGWALGDGWQFGKAPGRFAWNPNELYGIIAGTLTAIRALPGPAEW